MAIIGNTCDSVGDVFIIENESPIIGLTGLSSFTDNVTGSFFKEFQYSTDGINFFPWRELTNGNLLAISIQPTDNFLIKYRYTNLANASASFTDVQVSGSFSEVECGKTYQESIFAEFFDCHINEWAKNVTVKLYKKGIIPNYIERNDESNINGIDKDYINFWRAIATFFSYNVYFARNFKNFRSIEKLLDNFLRDRGIFFCATYDQAEKSYLVENYYDEIRQRGSSMVYKTKAQTGKGTDGELLRTICYDVNDDFIFNLYLPHTIGWSIGNSSPLYKGLSRQLATNKSYEYTQDFVDLDLYPTFGNGTQAIITDGAKEVYSILNVPDTEIAGIGDDDNNFAINVDPNLDYEITFYVRQPIAEANFTFGVLSYSQYGFSTTLKKITDGTDENNFFETIQLANTTDYYFVRGIIYNKNAISGNVQNSCFGNGIHLQMKSNTGKIIPYITLDNSTGGDAVNELRIWDLKMKPVATPYSTGFIGPKNFISIFAKHNNAEISRNQLESILRRFLLPYNSSFKVNYLNEDFAISS